ncbi:Uncharacterised protein g5927 [Pycnogonum litorale]
MPRVYKRKAGSRGYQTAYSQESLHNAIQQVKSGRLTMNAASKQFQIPYGTIWNKTRTIVQHAGKPGGQPVLSATEETAVVKVINHLTDWKFPLSSGDIRYLVQDYLNRQGRTTIFCENLPGWDWLDKFKKRQNLTQRIADNVKPSRSEISSTDVKEYFKNIFEELTGVEPQNVYNYDETNVTDNPGAKQCIVRRGLRRVERKTPHSKQAVSVMFCGNAVGEYLPPMVVYKSKNLYAEWTQGGPTGALYNHSASGWFDSSTFEEWFKLFLEHAKDKPGKKVLIGDNLASHFSQQVIADCEENNIKFVSLVPNATHLLQPLDVAVFGPAKKMWRRILEDWRKESRVRGGIPKTVFPSLLKRLCNQVEEKKSNLVAGFKACGLVPQDEQQVLKRLPDENNNTTETVQEALGEVVANMLKEHISPPAQSRKKRGPKVAPGKAVTSEDIAAQKETSNKPSASGTGSGSRQRAVKKGIKRKVIEVPSSSEEEDESDDDDEVCQICKKFNCGRSKNIRWEKCDNWFHELCLQKEGASNATSVCKCQN